MLFGLIYLRFDAAYIVERGIDRGMYAELYDNPDLRGELGLAHGVSGGTRTVAAEVKELRDLRAGPERNAPRTAALEAEVDHHRTTALEAWRKLDPVKREELANRRVNVASVGGEHERQLVTDLKARGVNQDGDNRGHATLLDLARARYNVPLAPGLNLEVAWCCLIGILLAVALNKCTEYWTSTEYSPVKEVVRASSTGHATNIISGLALGLESSVWAVLIISAGSSGRWRCAATRRTSCTSRSASP
jgi:hypothetical protein